MTDKARIVIEHTRSGSLGDNPFIKGQDCYHVRDFGPHLRCPVDTKDFMIYGSYETSVAQNFQAVFELCDEEKNKENPETASIVCANQTEVNEWMSFKYIMAVE